MNERLNGLPSAFCLAPRSTLDPSLYKSGGFDWKSGVLLATVLGYLFLPPGWLSLSFAEVGSAYPESLSAVWGFRRMR